LLLLAIILFLTTNWRIMETYPLCLFHENFMYVAENVAISDYCNTPYSCPPEYLRAGANEETFVLIIGESARRSSLSAYGYQRETSPRLDAWLKERPEQVALYQDAITPSAFTKASVMSIYSPLLIQEELSALHSRPGLAKIFRGSGFNTLYVTTRPKYDIRNMLSTFQDDAEQKTYLTTHLKRAFDEETLPVMQCFIDSKPGKRLIILHLMGSHRDYADQYPGTRRQFKSGDKMLDTYDDSILYSDHVMHELIDNLSARPEPMFVLYVSDHGENLNDMKDGYYGHGAKVLTRYDLQVPFVMYFNKSFIEKRPEAYALLRARSTEPVCHDYIAHTFMGLAGISDPFVYRSRLDLCSAAFQGCPRIITDENMQPFDYASYKFSRTPRFIDVGNKLAEEYRSKFTW
jgi:glucan phosphoethanolaminetransferase (alkaline phosphatase superfamily)